jgi:drug/metabolite transporter (DMT)-like permease
MARLAAWRWWVLGTIGIGILAPMYSVGLQHASPITAAILNSATPAIAAIVGWLFYRIPITRLMIPGIILTFAGCLIATYDPTAGGSPFDLRGGEILIIAAGSCWCWYSITSQRWMRGCSQLRISAVTTATGSVGLLLIYLLASAWGAGDFPPRTPGSDSYTLVFVWLSLVPIMLGNLLWLNAVSKIGLVISALYMNLVPTTTVAISAAMGIRPSAAQLIGGAIVLAGIMLAQLPDKWLLLRARDPR